MNITDLTGYTWLVDPADFPAAETSITGISFAVADGTQYSSITVTLPDGTYSTKRVLFDDALIYDRSTSSSLVNDKYEIVRFLNGDNAALVAMVLNGIKSYGHHDYPYEWSERLIAPTGPLRLGDVLSLTGFTTGQVTINGVAATNNQQLYHGDLIAASRTSTSNYFKPTHMVARNNSSAGALAGGWAYATNPATPGLMSWCNSSVALTSGSPGVSGGTGSEKYYVIYRTDVPEWVTDLYGYVWTGYECPPLSGSGGDASPYGGNTGGLLLFDGYASYYSTGTTRRWSNAQVVALDPYTYRSGDTSTIICSTTTADGCVWSPSAARTRALSSRTEYNGDLYNGEAYLVTYGTLADSHKTVYQIKNLPAGSGVVTVRARTAGTVSTPSNEVSMFKYPALPTPQIIAVNNHRWRVYCPSQYAGWFDFYQDNTIWMSKTGWGHNGDSYGSVDPITPYLSQQTLLYRRYDPYIQQFRAQEGSTTYNGWGYMGLGTLGYGWGRGSVQELRIKTSNGDTYYALTDMNDTPLSTSVSSPTSILPGGAYAIKRTDTIVTADTKYYVQYVPYAEIDAADVDLSIGAHTFFTKCGGPQLDDSVASTSWTYSVFGFTSTLTHCTLDTATTPAISKVYNGLSYSLQFTADTGYVMPNSITINDVTYTWTVTNGGATGELDFTGNFSTTTGTVALTIEAEQGHVTEQITIETGGGDPTGGGGTGYVWYSWDGTTAPSTWMANHAPDTSLTDLSFTTSTGYWLIGMDQWGGYELPDNYYLGITIVSGNITELPSGGYSGTNGTVQAWGGCMIKGTPITLADGSIKPIEDITYDDDLLVWDFYEGKLSHAHPFYIMPKRVIKKYNLVTFDNGAAIGFAGPGQDIGYHRIYNDEAKEFTHTGCADTPDGTTTFAQDGSKPKVVSQEVIYEEVEYFNIMTERHINLFADGILTSGRLSNRYEIKDMKYDLNKPRISEMDYEAHLERLAKKTLPKKE